MSASQASDGDEGHGMLPQAVDVSVDCLIVGTGPAGGALAALLAHYGVTGLIISREPTNSPTPRAHLVNMATMEVMRDLGIENQCRKNGLENSYHLHSRFSDTMVGEEYARVFAFGNGPTNKGRYELASPCAPLDLPQNELEPLLIRAATTQGFRCRFDTEFLSFEEDTANGTVDVLVKDLVYGRQSTIRTKYLFGADGGRSNIVRQLALPMTKREGGGLAWSVFVDVDLSQYMDTRRGNLHWVYEPGTDQPDFAWIGFPRVVSPWNKWLIILLPKPGFKTATEPSHEDWLRRIRSMIGDPNLEITIKDVARWNINETYAERYSSGRVFALGDAVHRHPPGNGLGANTCVQDAYNLAWKVAYVLKGRADQKLLLSYNDERQPVGRAVVERANDSVRHHQNIWTALGMLATTKEERIQEAAEMSEDSEAGRRRRQAFQQAVTGTVFEYQSLGAEMNQGYVSTGVYQADQGTAPGFTKNHVLEYQPTTYPGARVPHAWLNTTVPSKTAISTIDLVGKGRFTLLTGIGGSEWRSAAASTANALGIEIKVFAIGPRQDYEDPYFTWADSREVEEAGCVLVRPDGFVAWRCKNMIPNCGTRLLEVLTTILSR